MAMGQSISEGPQRKRQNVKAFYFHRQRIWKSDCTIDEVNVEGPQPVRGAAYQTIEERKSVMVRLVDIGHEQRLSE